ncbi:eukaryotic translation initiation factor 2 beta subunit-like [Striga asiatica]|uniref:Eukaryotic translation initiation factor 2 subunit beta n=2 Tax=Lamiales TaxID=4143 RepID=A0A5A7Q2U7_STRAF|nr:eukaryotic translation initiation factor 2 beta subunit-like [Striga asiatica]
MGSQAIDISWPSSIVESFDTSFDIQIEEENSADKLDFFEDKTEYCSSDISKPPPLPRKKITTELVNVCCVPKETRDLWEKLFKNGFGADVRIISSDGLSILAHHSVLSVASQVLGYLLQQSKVENGVRRISIPGVPYGALRAFIRFLYSSCFERDDMNEFVLHLLVLSHSYAVPSLKRVCENFLEQVWLTKENVIDVLQLARICDAPRLSLVCIRMVVRDFKCISITEAWKVMRRSNPSLEQELLESVVEADTRKQERMKKIEEKKVYLQLHEAMEALLHISREGCRTIGPRDKVLNGSQVSCGFSACKGLETLIRHFSCCKAKVPGGCAHCKRMWQLLELHSRMCNDPDYCKAFQGENAAAEEERRGKMESVGKQSGCSKECSEIALTSEAKCLASRKMKPPNPNTCILEKQHELGFCSKILIGAYISFTALVILIRSKGNMADDENHNEIKEGINDVHDIAPFDPTKKKKKKKPVPQDLAEEEPVDSLVEKAENLSISETGETSFAGLKKKKKKPAHTDLLIEEKENVAEDLDDVVGEDEEGEGIVLQQYPWEGTDRDYHYEELLGRVFNILRENNPELAGDRRRTVMRPPQVLREGTKKTVFVNFMDLCKTMHRQPEHVMTFLLAEMGTSGSLDGQQRLVVKGRFAPKNFEGILRRYINEYVICNGCKSPDTILSKENRLFFLRCEKCGSGRSVAPIKAGFVARVGRRKAGT